jgi:hypothetical protein
MAETIKAPSAGGQSQSSGRARLHSPSTVPSLIALHQLHDATDVEQRAYMRCGPYAERLIHPRRTMGKRHGPAMPHEARDGDDITRDTEDLQTPLLFSSERRFIHHYIHVKACTRASRHSQVASTPPLCRAVSAPCFQAQEAGTHLQRLAPSLQASVVRQQGSDQTPQLC